MREPLLGVAVGKKGVGKTYTTTKMIEHYIKGNPAKGVKPRRALILDVNDEFETIRSLHLKDVPKFSAHPKIEARRVRPFKKNGEKMTLREIADALFFILQHYRGGLLLIEDINKYLSDSLPNDVVGAMCTNRHTDTDIIVHFQSIGRITTKIWQNINWLRFHKNTDSVDRHKDKFIDKYQYLKIAEMLVNQKYNSGDERYYLFADIDRELVTGKFTVQEVETAINNFISINHNSLINPLLKYKSANGGLKYTSESAQQHVKTELLRHFSI